MKKQTTHFKSRLGDDYCLAFRPGKVTANVADVTCKSCLNKMKLNNIFMGSNAR